MLSRYGSKNLPDCRGCKNLAFHPSNKNCQRSNNDHDIYKIKYGYISFACIDEIEKYEAHKKYINAFNQNLKKDKLVKDLITVIYCSFFQNHSYKLDIRFNVLVEF